MESARLFKYHHGGIHIQYVTIYLFAVLLFFLLISCACPHVSDYKDDTLRVPGEILITLKSGKFEIKSIEYKTQEKIQKGEIIIMKGFESTSSPGDPVLPFQIYDVAVPPNIDWRTLKLTMENVETVVLPGKHIIPPALPLFYRINDEEFIDWGDGKAIVNGRNMVVYGKREFFPAEPVKIQSMSQMRKWKFIRIGFNPVQYNPVDRTLRLIESAQVYITFGRIGIKVFRSEPILGDTLMDDEAKRRFINYKEALEWYRYVPNLKLRKDVQDPDYVIITTNAIKYNSAKLTDFMNHKIALGHTVQVVTEDDYGTLEGQAPNGTAEKIRQWLKDNYSTLGIQYVLLIGNPDPDDPLDPSDMVGDVPMKMMWPDRFHHRRYDIEAPTDYFYADLTGNWDLDSDGFFGERTSYTNMKSPDPAINPDTFSVRWKGRFMADVDGTYRFVAISDNGIRVYVNSTIIIDNWTSHYPTTDNSWITLTAGVHDIEIEYYNDTGDGVAKLYWGVPDWGLAIIPSTKLLHLVSSNYVAGGLDAEYFNNADFTAPVLTRVDDTIDFIWGTGDRGPGGVDFFPEVYVGRIPVYDSDPSTPSYEIEDFAVLDTILQKTINYETGNPPVWRKKFLTANPTFYPPLAKQSDYQLSEALKADFADPLGFMTYRIYESDFGIVPPPECPAINPKDADHAAPCNMLGEWANGGGYGLLLWGTHGDATTALYLISSVDSIHLNNTSPAFTFQNSCSTGYPERSDNLGYSLLKQGAIGTISASRVSLYALFFPNYGDPNPLKGSGENLAYYYASRIMQNDSAGLALFMTKAIYTDLELYFRNMMVFNLYGDPSVSLFLSLSVGINVSPTSGKLPLTVNFTGNATGGTVPYSYSWNFGDGESSSEQNPTYTYFDAGDFTVTLTVTDSESNQDSDSLTISASAPATPLEASCVASPTSGTAPLTVNFAGNATGGTVPYSYSWNFGDGESSSEQNPTHTYSDAGDYTVTLTVTGSEGNQDSAFLIINASVATITQQDTLKEISKEQMPS